MAHSCKRPQSGHKVCYEHRLQWTSIRQWFKKMMIDTFPVDELKGLHTLTTAAMLPRDGTIPLDDCPQETIDRVGEML